MKKGYADVLIGLQYGDEGKAKVIDLLAPDYDIVARFNGGANAGHSIEAEGQKIALNQIPSSIFHPHTLLYIGSGCIVNLEKTWAEVKKIQALGIDLTGRLHICDQASVIQPHHILLDQATGETIGTTHNGIGPAYADRALRMDGQRTLSIRLCDLLDSPKEFFGYIKQNFIAMLQQRDVPGDDCDASLRAMEHALASLTPFVQRDTLFLQKRASSGARILFEGAQSVMLDIAKGSVPFVTSSHTVAGSAYVGGDLSPDFHRRTIGVAKAIMSRVGHGPFVSEFGGHRSETYCMEQRGTAHTQDMETATYSIESLLASEESFDVGIALRMLGHEYGTVSKRPRRVGALDLVQLSFAIRMNGVDQLFLTKCDLLIDFARTKIGAIPLVTGYTLGTSSVDYVPGSLEAYRNVQTTTQFFPPFSTPLAPVRHWNNLPRELLNLLNTIEKTTACPLLGIGTGSMREAYVLQSR